MTEVVPPHPRSWYELLPAPYCNNPVVVVVMVPNNWQVGTTPTTDGKYTIAVMRSDKETIRALQVIDVDVCTYMEQREVFYHYNVEPADPAYIGPLADIFNDLLLDTDRRPVVFHRDAMWRAPIDLNKVWMRSELKC